jgi:hypothetical protein
MKKYLVILLLLIAIPAFARMLCAPSGGSGTAVSCTPCNSGTDSLFDSSATTTNTETNSSNYIAWQFVTVTTKCITGVKFSTRDAGMSRGCTCEIWTDSGGSPNAIVGAGYTSTIADLPNGDTYPEFLFAATQTLAAGTYWGVCKTTGGNIVFGKDTAHTGNQAYNDGSWHADITSHYIMGVLGCDQS